MEERSLYTFSDAFHNTYTKRNRKTDHIKHMLFTELVKAIHSKHKEINKVNVLLVKEVYSVMEFNVIFVYKKTGKTHILT